MRAKQKRALLSLWQTVACLSVLAALFFLLLVGLSGNGWKGMWQQGHAEDGVYVEASSYVANLWRGFRSIDSMRGAREWVTAFIFHLSPFEFGEKPLFIMGLGYFTCLYRLLPEGSPIVADACFNLFLIALSGGVVTLLFRRLQAPFMGLLAALFIFLQVGLTYYSLIGYHTTFGIFLFLVAATLVARWPKPTAGQSVVQGIAVSSVFFASHHTVFLFAASALFLTVDTLPLTRSRRFDGRRLCFLLVGLLIPFIYFMLRDAAVSLNLFATYRQPDLAPYIANYDKPHIEYVFQCFLALTADELTANLPQDFTYVFHYLRDVEGSLFTALLCVGTLCALVLTPARSRRLGLLPDKASCEKLLLRRHLFAFFMVNILVHYAAMVLLRLPYIARAYLPMVMLLLLASLLGFSICRLVRKLRTLVACLLGAAVVLQGLHYQHAVSRLNDFPRQTENATLATELLHHSKTPEEICALIASMQKTGDHLSCMIEPLILTYGHHSFSNPGIYGFFMDLMAHGVPFEAIRSDNMLLTLVLYDNEHVYYQIGRGRITCEVDQAYESIAIASVFDPRTYYVFELDDIIQHFDRE